MHEDGILSQHLGLSYPGHDLRCRSMRVFYAHSDNWIGTSPGVTFMTMTGLGLARAGAETHLIVPGISEGDTADLLRSHFAEELPAGLTLHRLTSGHRAFLSAAVQRIVSLVQPQDVVITRSLSLLPGLLRLRSRAGFRCYFESHDCYFAPWQRDDVSLWATWKPMLRERWHLPRVDGLICLRQTQAEIYRRHLGPNVPIHVVPTGYSATNQIPRTWSSTPVLAYLGSLCSHKGLDNVARLAAAHPSAQALIIGGKNEREIAETRALFSARGCPPERVRITGWIDKHRMAIELATAHWGICPLHDTYFNRYLTSPVKIHDYFAEGLPVVTSDLPCLRELVTDGQDGLIVDWQRPEQIAERLSGVERPSYDQMCQRSQARASAWTWVDRGRELIRVMQ